MGGLSEKLKNRLLMIIIGATLFAMFYILDNIIELPPLWAVIILTASYLILGYKVILTAIKNVFRGKLLDENFLMSIATIGAYALGDYTECVAVMLFYQIGEFFQSYAVGKSRKSITDLMDICPEYANIETEDGIVQVSPDEINVGDVIIVKPGEKIPIDSVVAEGDSFVDTSSITGESTLRKIKIGDNAYSGFVNMKSPLKLKTIKSFDDSTVSKILDLVENSSFNKSKSENFITNFAKVYTPVVVGCAVLLCVVPTLIMGDFAVWLKRALLFLVISCPCALVISVPMSFFSAIGCASKNGILVKGSNYLEALSKASEIVFDKTGTLTHGNFKVTEICPSENSNEDELIMTASECEYFSDHPIAESVKAKYKPDKKPQNHEEIPGMGICAELDNKRICAGNAALMKKEGIKFDISDIDYGTVIYVSSDSKYLGYIVISDEIKEEASHTVSLLKSKGLTTCMLTGDRGKSAIAVSQKIGIEKTYSELLPQDKTKKLEEIISSKKKGSTVIYVGDGINDAPSLTLSDVGIAMGSLGSDAAIEAADIVIMDDNISRISLAHAISLKTKKIVHENVIFAIGVKILVMILGAFGVANMWAAVFADVGVAFIAILNSMRSFGCKELTKKN